MFYLDWQLTSECVAIHLPTSTAVAADLHLGYLDARRRSGDAVPSADVATQLSPLIKALTRNAAQRLVIAGDLFEKAFDPEIWRAFQNFLARAGVSLLSLVPGNHDRGLEKAPADFPVCPDGVVVGDWRVVHGDGPLPNSPVVLGHFHPCVLRRGRKIPCYLCGERTLVLPAYSKEAAGSLPDKRWQGFRRVVIGDS